MRVYKNLYGNNSKINASEIAFEGDLLNNILLATKYNTLKILQEEVNPNFYVNNYHTFQCSSRINLNDLIYDGTYYVLSGDSNRPVSSNGYLQVISANTGHCVQYFTQTTRSNTTLYIRKRVSEVWGDWGTI